MLGKPTPDCGSGGTSVPSARRGIREDGGATPFVDHSSSATHSARCTGAESSGFRNCWQLPLLVGLPAPPCCLLARLYRRVSGWSARSTVPIGSVWKSDAAFTQYSFDE